MDTYPHAPHLSDSVTIDVFLCAQSPFALKSNRLLVAFTSPTQMTCGAKAILKAGAGGKVFDSRCLAPCGTRSQIHQSISICIQAIHMLSISYTTRFNFRPNLHDGGYKLLVACMEYTVLGKPISKVSSSRLNGENAFAVINCFFFMSLLKFGR